MLAKYKREQPRFEEVFGVSPAKLIQEMDSAAADIANQAPQYDTELTTVGVHRNDIPVNIADPLDGALTHQLRCSVRVSVSLNAMRRGIHVSRMSNALADLSTQRYSDLLDFTTIAAQKIAESQGASSCRVRADGVYTFLELVEGWQPSKNKTSIEALPLIAETFHSADIPARKSAGFKVSHITACPCVQSALLTLLRLKGIDDRGVPLFTHSQRCETQILLRNVTQYFDFATALRLTDKCTTRTQNTLPREHELALVHGSHKTPSFLEDVVRMCANEFHQTFGAILEATGSVHVSSASQESIHCFDLHAEATVPEHASASRESTAARFVPRVSEVEIMAARQGDTKVHHVR